MRLLLLLCAWATLIGAVDATIEATVDADGSTRTSHFSGLHVISGSGFRSFSNRFKRHLRNERRGADLSDCLRFHEAGNWWHYEWCVGRTVRHFHAFDDGSGHEWSIKLGQFTRDTSTSMRIVRVDDPDAQRNPDVRGYMAEQIYPQGQLCDLGNGKTKARAASVQYKCCVFRANETYIESVEEATARCSYTLSVCTPVACGLVQTDQYVLGASARVSDEERLVLAQTVKDMFYHAYNGYMKHAFPLDALLPLSCKGETFELGKIQMLTLIDTLDTLAILEDAPEFQRAVALVVARADFNLDTEVSVFETTIRVLGGLLSAHLFAQDASLRLFPPGEYKNELLELAIDLADRMMPAFNTTTGIPYGTVNLRHGVPKGETPIASTAGAGSLSMEFTMLSVLSGDPRYATASRRAVRGLFERRSQVNLLGKHIDTRTGEWTETTSGPGSNSDSFYEYLWKMYATFGDTEMLEMFDVVYAAVLECNAHGDWFADVSMWSGCAHSSGVIFENLVSFWPGMQASLGHLNGAARSVNAFYRVWRDYGFVPEQFNVHKWKPVRGGSAPRYPLRPELIESTFYMHEATNDSSWLRAGAHFVHSLQKHTKTQCGYATVKDIETKELEDNMPSFFLSETCKYLYLLFNTTHYLRNGSYVFTTEAHPFPVLPAKQVQPVILPTFKNQTNHIHSRSINRRRCPKPVFWHPLGYQVDYEGIVVDRTERCARPTSPTNAMPASKSAEVVDEWLPLLEKHLRESLDKMRGPKQLDQPHDKIELQLYTEDGRRLEENSFQYLHGGSKLGLFRVDKTDGVLRVTRQDTGEWLEASGFDDPRYTVLSWLPERRGFGGMTGKSDSVDENDELPLLLPRHRVYDFVNGKKDAALRRFCSLVVEVDPSKKHNNPYKSEHQESDSKSHTISCVGSSFAIEPSPEVGSQRFPKSAVILAEPLDACVPLQNAAQVEGKTVVVKRGTCFFETKARNALAAGAVSVIVVNHEEDDRVMVMSGSNEPMDFDDDHIQQSVAIPVIMVPRRMGEWLNRQIIKATSEGVLAEIHLSVKEREQDIDAINTYLEAIAISTLQDDAVANAHDHDSLLFEAYPRMETAAGTIGQVRVMAPEWGLDLRVMNSHDWLLEIVSTPQTIEHVNVASP